MGIPHIEHVILRGYFKGLYKQEKWRDINGNSLLRGIRGHKDRMWWQGVRGETHAKKRKEEGCTRGGRGKPVEHEDFIVMMMGMLGKGSWNYVRMKRAG